MDNLTNLISAAVAAKMTPDFIEKEVNTRVEKLVVESVDKALRTWSDTGQLIEKAIEEALRVDRLDLPTYGNVVAAMVKAQVEAKVAPLIAGRLAEDIDELLKLAPATVKLSEIAADMLKRHDDDAYGEVITVIVEQSEYGSTWVYLDEDQVHDERNKYRCDYRLLIGKDGKISSATLREHDIKSSKHFGTSYGLEQKLRAYFACGTVIEIDEDRIVTSAGDY
ncbi:hypothetical protein ACH37Y_06175 [Sphingomonas paucimobilis]|uniref:hypothetical protein n=1 Tax=Sphingomonas paucimobilis TaxID=13689 RepID=UPI0037966437